MDSCRVQGCGEDHASSTRFCVAHQRLWLASHERRDVDWTSIAEYEFEAGNFAHRVAQEEMRQRETDELVKAEIYE